MQIVERTGLDISLYWYFIMMRARSEKTNTINNLSMCTHVININNLLLRNLYTRPNIYILRQNLHGFYHLPLQNHK